MNLLASSATLLAQDPSLSTHPDAVPGALFAMFAVFMAFWLALSVVMLAAMWKMYAKAGEPGWAVLIPIYNVVVMLRIVGRPTWWLVLMLIPFVNLAVMVILCIDTSRSYGRDIGVGLLLLVLPFIGYPMLGFGKAEYMGPAA